MNSIHARITATATTTATAKGYRFTPLDELPPVLPRQPVAALSELPDLPRPTQATYSVASPRPSPEAARADLPRTAYRIYELLWGAALRVSQARGYSSEVTHVTVFCPAEALAHTLGIHRDTVRLNMRHLLELGLVDSRVKFGNYKDSTRVTGTVYKVKMDPRATSSPRLRYDELKHPYRDLESDIREGKTAYALKNTAVKELPPHEQKIKQILSWTLPAKKTSSPLDTDCRISFLEAVSDLSGVPQSERREAVDKAAHSLSNALRDSHSLNFYRKLMWDLLHLKDRGRDHFQTVYLAAQRAQVDTVEGFARSPGALFVSRLQKMSIWLERQQV